MISNIFNKNIVKILSFLLISPGSKYTRNEIKEKTKMNNVPLDKTLNIMLNLNIIKKEKKFLNVNMENEEISELIKKVRQEYHKLSVPYNIFIILMDISEKLLELKFTKKVILFGSYAKLIYSESSDIDIVVILHLKKREINKDKKTIEKEINKISKKNKKEIELHFFSYEDLKHKEDALIKDILRNGKEII
ncbi:nucleotidyltransferase domain-containing protein [Candidatus Pacearchaeota archaeon]|nr:nucleotidyltransferase domain-containing protein [Candidatus Pacearchaeota archaeon]